MADQLTADAKGRLLAEFPAPSLDVWKEEVVRLLKGAPFEKKMLTATYEGITLQPMYTAEDTKNLPFQDTLPGQWPYLRGTEPLGKSVNGWLVTQELPFPDPKDFNEALLHDLERGQNAVCVLLDAAGRWGLDADEADLELVGKDGTSISAFADALQALEGVYPAVPIMVVGGAGSVPAAALIIAALKAKGADLSSANLTLGNDPLGFLAQNGQLPMSIDEAFDGLASLTNWASANAPKAKTLVACGFPYFDAGANAVQQLAFTLSSAVAALRAMEARGISVEDAASRMVFRLKVGGNFFMEIAKLRAMRVLWAQVARACGASDEAAKICLQAKNGRINKTQFDPHVNILRGTTEAFAAIAGGADYLHIASFDDALGGPPSELGRRIARNTQLILREESKLDHVVDLAGGSWTVETLTHQLMVAAWKLFQEVDAMGGLQEALEKGFVQKAILDIANARRKAVATRTDIIVGINQYPNALEGLPEQRTIDHAVVKAKLGPPASAARTGQAKSKDFGALVDAAPKSTLGEISKALGASGSIKVEPLVAFRAAETFESLRKAMIKGRKGKTDVFLANLGPVGAYMPRLDFTRAFFQIGGFTVEDKSWFKTPDEAAKAAIASGAPIVVAVGLDDTYIEQAEGLAKAVKAGGIKTMLVAGLLKDHADAFKAAGVDDFVHIKSDAHAVLSGLAKGLGVTL
ncbi:MAG: acyl-CoA mutase large subunit family protein [Holophagales bacterium]|jgi:methylmalonyl-CoA mutase|nr:acyl-CoA mutase large subunit family protein [Holophagales bacterium]